jgi:predicted TIM-barrel fold metal-dependent hydrolase
MEEERVVIDVNGHFGPRLNPDPDAPLDELRAQAARYGVGTTLAYHTTAVHLDPTSGNDAAIAAADASDGAIRPIAVVASYRSDLLDPPVHDLVRHGVVGFRLGVEAREWHHGGYDAAYRSSSMQTLLRAIARAGKPIIAPILGWGHAAAIGEATDGLGVPVLVSGSHYAWNADDLETLLRYSHLYLETSRLAHFRAIEDAVRIVGADRLVFGSDSPTRSLLSPINAVAAAEIPDDAKRAILGGNAARLFGLPAPTFDLPAPVLPTDAVDVHTHYGPMPWGVPQPADADLAPAFRRLGVAANIASPTRAIVSDLAAGNAQGVAAADPSRGQYTYLAADPWDLDLTRAQLRRHGDATGVVGVKVHALLHRMNTSDSRMAALFDVLADYGRPVKIHNEGADWADALLAIARAHPRLPIIIAHSGLGFPSPDAGRIAAAAPNIHPELASSFAFRPWVRDLIARTPREQLLYGTDGPLLNPAYINGTFVDGGVSIDDAAVFRENARRIFGL